MAFTGPVQAQGVQRSAKSDCTREVERRGYQVVSTSNFQQSKDGWQVDVRARDHRGRTVDGSCFVETRTGDVSLYGFGWGGSGTIDSFEFACASKDEKYRECQLPIDGRARLVKRKSDAPCIEGQTWGQRGDRVWVSRGCRATFNVGRGGSGGSGNSNQGQQSRAEDQCRKEAKGRGIKVRSSGPARQRGSYWEALVQGTFNGQPVSPVCRYYPGSNRAELQFGNSGFGGSGGSGGTGSGFGGSGGSGGTGSGFGGSGGSGGSGSGGSALAMQSCVKEAGRQGYKVVGQNAPHQAQGGYEMSLKLRQGNGAVLSGQCRYWSQNGRAQIEIRGSQSN